MECHPPGGIEPIAHVVRSHEASNAAMSLDSTVSQALAQIKRSMHIVIGVLTCLSVVQLTTVVRNVDVVVTEPASRDHRAFLYANGPKTKSNDATTEMFNEAPTPRVWMRDVFDGSQLYTSPNSDKSRGYERGSHLRLMHSSEKNSRDGNGRCSFYAKWHKNLYPTCNNVHEVDLNTGLIQDSYPKNSPETHSEFGISYTFHGSSRQAWKLKTIHNTCDSLGGNSNASNRNDCDEQRPVIFKNLLFEKEYREVMFEHQRVDAVATERLTSSPHSIDVYNFCGESTVTEYADGGNLEDLYLNGVDSIPSTQRLIFARDAALGMADFHDLDGNLTTMVHHDIKPPNMVIVDGKLKYNDFNNAQFLKWDFNRNQRCGFHWGHACGGNEEKHTNQRAPEECRLPKHLFTEQVETYRLGVLLFFLLTGSIPFRFEPDDIRPLDVKAWVISGRRPALPRHVQESTDPATRAIINAMRRAMTVDINDRPRTREIADQLVKEANKIRSKF